VVCEASPDRINKGGNEMAGMSRRFWLEAGFGGISGLLFVITLIWRDWVEIAFQIDPDQGSGALEWAIVVVLGLVTLSLTALAGVQWRKEHATAFT
jgi:hypothetical protein